MSNSTGVVAAGRPLTAEAGAEVLRAGGNAVDAAVCAVLTSFVADTDGGELDIYQRFGARRC